MPRWGLGQVGKLMSCFQLCVTLSGKTDFVKQHFKIEDVFFGFPSTCFTIQNNGRHRFLSTK